MIKTAGDGKAHGKARHEAHGEQGTRADADELAPQGGGEMHLRECQARHRSRQRLADSSSARITGGIATGRPPALIDISEMRAVASRTPVSAWLMR